MPFPLGSEKPAISPTQEMDVCLTSKSSQTSNGENPHKKPTDQTRYAAISWKLSSANILVAQHKLVSNLSAPNKLRRWTTVQDFKEYLFSMCKIEDFASFFKSSWDCFSFPFYHLRCQDHTMLHSLKVQSKKKHLKELQIQFTSIQFFKRYSMDDWRISIITATSQILSK